jgi:hypothetical protein
MKAEKTCGRDSTSAIFLIWCHQKEKIEYVENKFLNLLFSSFFPCIFSRITDSNICQNRLKLGQGHTLNG